MTAYEQEEMANLNRQVNVLKRREMRNHRVLHAAKGWIVLCALAQLTDTGIALWRHDHDAIWRGAMFCISVVIGAFMWTVSEFA